MLSTDEGMHFEPHVVWVETGGTVTWTVESGVHSTTAYHPDNDKPQRIPDGAPSWDSGILSEGKRFELTLDADGVYDYFCIPHEGMGMVASIIVGRPASDGQPGLAPPQDELPDSARAKITELNKSVTDALNG